MTLTLKEILIKENLMLSGNPRGTDKGDYKSYIEKFYEGAFQPFRNKKISLLEIGTRHGASLALWSSYFELGQIMGIDNYSDLALLDDPPDQNWVSRPNVKILSADAYDPEFARSINIEFDIVIDDGPHSKASQKAALMLYLPKLKMDGLFIIEDIQSWARLAVFGFIRFIPMRYSIHPLDFRADGKGDDNFLFVVKRCKKFQTFNHIKVLICAIFGIMYEVLIKLRTFR